MEGKKKWKSVRKIYIFKKKKNLLNFNYIASAKEFLLKRDFYCEE